jgi:hypothetical protein
VSPESERLLEQLAEFRANPQSVGTQQPKFTEWVGFVRQWLRFREDREGLRLFESLRVAKAPAAMWRRDETPPAEVREILSDLKHVEALLRKEPERQARKSTVPPAPRQRGTAVPSAPQAKQAGPSGGGRNEEEKPVKEKSGADDMPPPQIPASPTARFEAMESLLGELEKELRRTDGDAAKIQRTMADLLERKRLGDLVDKVFTNTSDPDCRWATVRDLLAQLWAANREVVVDLLPALLKKG